MRPQLPAHWDNSEYLPPLGPQDRTQNEANRGGAIPAAGDAVAQGEKHPERGPSPPTTSPLVVPRHNNVRHFLFPKGTVLTRTEGNSPITGTKSDVREETDRSTASVNALPGSPGSRPRAQGGQRPRDYFTCHGCSVFPSCFSATSVSTTLKGGQKQHEILKARADRRHCLKPRRIYRPVFSFARSKKLLEH